MFKNLVKKLKSYSDDKQFSAVTSPVQENETLKNMSKHALSLYERQTDIKNFTKLALSNPENTEQNELVDKLFKSQGISNPFEDEAIFELSENTRFLHDLGLD